MKLLGNLVQPRELVICAIQSHSFPLYHRSPSKPAVGMELPFSPYLKPIVQKKVRKQHLKNVAVTPKSTERSYLKSQ